MLIADVGDEEGGRLLLNTRLFCPLQSALQRTLAQQSICLRFRHPNPLALANSPA
ncbi:unnamed protein product [Mycena citricolor]|uniref:Uncharacterized protein n=1 Tax=Mycena citricolor TaxID=2018698 RepID=A0AAD2H797_9AGAR|nr:unnamed protein product [Mycena citricolor]